MFDFNKTIAILKIMDKSSTSTLLFKIEGLDIHDQYTYYVDAHTNLSVEKTYKKTLTGN